MTVHEMPAGEVKAMLPAVPNNTPAAQHKPHYNTPHTGNVLSEIVIPPPEGPLAGLISVMLGSVHNVPLRVGVDG